MRPLNSPLFPFSSNRFSPLDPCRRTSASVVRSHRYLLLVPKTFRERERERERERGGGAPSRVANYCGTNAGLINSDPKCANKGRVRERQGESAGVRGGGGLNTFGSGNGNYRLHFAAAPIIVTILCSTDGQLGWTRRPRRTKVDDASLSLSLSLSPRACDTTSRRCLGAAHANAIIKITLSPCLAKGDRAASNKED